MRQQRENVCAARNNSDVVNSDLYRLFLTWQNIIKGRKLVSDPCHYLPLFPCRKVTVSSYPNELLALRMHRSTSAVLVSVLVLLCFCFVWNVSFRSVELVAWQSDVSVRIGEANGQHQQPAYVAQLKNLFSGLRRTENLHQSLSKMVHRLHQYRQNIARRHLSSSWRQALSDNGVSIQCAFSSY
jgi:hypothetical protein